MDWPAIKREMLNLQFAWWAAHVTVVIHCFLYFLSFLLPAVVSWWPLNPYTTALKGALTALLIALYKRHPNFQLSQQYLQSVLPDENLQYVILAVVLLLSTQFAPAIVPFAAISTLNAASFFRSNAHKFIQETTARQIGAVLGKVLSQQKAIFERVALVEVLTVPFGILNIFLGGSLFIPLGFYQVLSIRIMLGQSPQYYGQMNVHTRHVLLHTIFPYMDSLLLRPQAPTRLREWYLALKGRILAAMNTPQTGAGPGR